jgi:hypothetical protein
VEPGEPAFLSVSLDPDPAIEAYKKEAMLLFSKPAALTRYEADGCGGGSGKVAKPVFG